MSNKVRAILRNPEGKRQLMDAIANLNAHETVEVTIMDKHYELRFINVEAKQ